MTRFEAEHELLILLNKQSIDYVRLADLYNSLRLALEIQCKQGLCTLKAATNKLQYYESEINKIKTKI